MAHFMYESDPNPKPQQSGANLMYESDPNQKPQQSGANLMYESDPNQKPQQSGANLMYESDPNQKPQQSGAYSLYEIDPNEKQQQSGAYSLYESDPNQKPQKSGAYSLYETNPNEKRQKSTSHSGAHLLYETDPNEEPPSRMPKESPRDLPGYVPLPSITAEIPPPITEPPQKDPGVVIYTRGKGGDLNREVTVGMKGTTVVNHERLEPLPKFFEKSIPIHCPECMYKGMSVTKKKPGCAVITNMLLLCAIGLVCIFFLPICLPDRTYDTYHYCPKCDAKLGKFTKKLCYTPEEYEELQDNS